MLDADIAKCFDKIDHKKLLAKLETYPLLRREIKSWLKSGYMDGKELFPTNKGTPQAALIKELNPIILRTYINIFYQMYNTKIH